MPVKGVSRTAAVCASLLAAATLSLTIAMLVARRDDYAAAVTFGVVLMAVAVMGGFVAAHRPSHPCGWLMASAALSYAMSGFATDYVQSSLAAEKPYPATTAVGWLSTWAPTPVIGLGVLLVMTFPSGTFGSPAFRVLGRVAIAATVAHALATACAPGSLPVAGSLDNPLGITGAGSVLDVVESAATTVLAIAGVAAIARLVIRSRRAEGVERAQLRLVGRAVVVAAVGTAFVIAASGPLNDLSFYVAAVSLSTVPLAIGWAVVRHGLFTIDVLVNRAIVFAVLTGAVAALYVLAVGLAGFAVGGSLDLRVSLLAAAVVAVAFGPAHEALQRWVDKMMYGDRAAPYDLLSRLTRRLQDAVEPGSLLPVAIDELGSSMKLRGVTVDLLRDHAMAKASTWGEELGPGSTFDLVHGGELVGQLTVWTRPDDQLRARDLALLESLCASVAAVAHAANVAVELQESRQALVTAMEEERRRLRSDLHDGLGPELAGVGMTVAAARLELQRNPTAADALLEGIQEQVRGAVSQVRLLVDGLAPAVDQLGLVGAVRQGADRLGGSDSVRFGVESADLPPLPAAVEVAAYRIAMEAMTNVVRHAKAHRCMVRLSTTDDRLTLEVADDGDGLPKTVVPGIGLGSMRQRALELGGACTIERSVDGGTRVLAELPL